eukprot:1052199-Prorocentrum_minimum.AAC.1
MPRSASSSSSSAPSSGGSSSILSVTPLALLITPAEAGLGEEGGGGCRSSVPAAAEAAEAGPGPDEGAPASLPVKATRWGGGGEAWLGWLRLSVE